jgi:hypothetical protein
MDIGTAVGLVGIIVAVILGLYSVRKISKQKQVVKNSSVGIQAGKDVNIDREND